MAVLSKGTLFPEHLVNDLISKVQGKSSLAKLSNQIPVPFNGLKEFVFSMDSEIDIVAENGAKSEGGISIDPVKVVPLKVEYGARVSDEFLYASEEEQIKILQSFNDGYAKKLAKGFDLMAFHGINPRTKAVSSVIGDNCFDKKVTQSVTFDGKQPDLAIESAVDLVEGSEGDVTGLAIDTTFRSALAKETVDGEGKGARLYPELRWGGNPGSLNGVNLDVNRTVANGGNTKAYLGDFGMFKWGYAKQIPLEVIEYGDPDNSGKDLKGYNQVYLRAETYIGWGILSPEHFAIIKGA
ncbi:phage major capsid family protein [Anaerococcus lactolyticus]|uniref:phage major capsid family protein n=1 Tax=Anaerococcus lactolyticus TaxID=33032 RepID=UPI0028892B0E|nr:phage major capsid protein [Anaerococcus lactolyticus]